MFDTKAIRLLICAVLLFVTAFILVSRHGTKYGLTGPNMGVTGIAISESPGSRNVCPSQVLIFNPHDISYGSFDLGCKPL